MLPQYAQRDRGAEVALWLLFTVGALLIPIIIIAICCIRRHWLTRPRIKLMQSQFPRTMMTTKQVEGLRSYNGPYTESGNDEAGRTYDKSLTPTSSRTNSLKKQKVHWPDRSSSPNIDNLHSILTESPSAHRRPSNSTLSHFIKTAIIPAGSTVSNIGTSQFLTPSKEFTSISANFNSDI